MAKKKASAAPAHMDRRQPAAVWVKTSLLKPWLQNPRVNKAAVPGVIKSIKKYGFGNALLVRQANNEIIAGHTRLAAAIEMKLDEVPARYLDLSEADAHALALVDNKSGEVAKWDEDLLPKVLKKLKAQEVDITQLGWKEHELDRMLSLLNAKQTARDEAPDPPAKPVSRTGEIYELGPHRLVCGDSKDMAVWEALLGGKQLDLVWTDPPYGVKYEGEGSGGLTIENDDLSEEKLRELMVTVFGHVTARVKKGGAVYVACPHGPLHEIFQGMLKQYGIWRQTLVWVKNALVMGRSDYHYRHEPILYGWVPGATHYFTKDRSQDSVFEFPKPTSSKLHPTMKPIALVAKQIANSSKRDALVGDPFGGSGTTLMAAAQEERRAAVVELSPAFCDVIRRRWTTYAKENRIEPGSGALGK